MQARQPLLRVLAFVSVGLLSAGLLSGMVQAAPPAKSAGAPAPATRPALPISLLDVMRASVEIPADGIWAVEFADKLSEGEWQLADQDAVNLISASTLIARSGTGKNDAKWVANADWQAWVLDMQRTALQIRAAAKAKDQQKMAAAADHLQEICEGCHSKYRPQESSDGVNRYPFYPKRELTK